MYMPKFGACALALFVAAGAANAATYTASSVVEDQTTYGTCTLKSYCDTNDRRTVSNALGESDSRFYALGFGGTLTLAFQQAVFGPGAEVTLQEVTFGNPAKARHFEAVDVYAVLNGAATLVRTVYNSAATVTFNIAQSFEHLRFVDVTKREFASTTSFDGYDVESVKVTVSPVPVPAAGGLLLAGLFGMGMIGRRRRNAC